MIQIVSQRYKIDGVGNSMQGGRTENQDDLGCQETPLGFLLVVCDGMGGGPGGKTASYIVKQQVLETISNSSPQSTPAEAIKMAVDKANEALLEKMEQMPELKGMGSTLVAILINEQSATIAHLGDSRCYQVRGNNIVFRTKDHSLVGELVRNGAITEEQARTSPQSNVITRGLGSMSDHVPEIEEVPYKQGDRFILCTDGVWGIMPHSDLQMRLCNQQDVPTLVKSLSEEIDKIGYSRGGHHDNHTLAVIEIKTDSILKEPMKKAFKTILGVGAAVLLCSIIFNVICFIRLGSEPQTGALNGEIEMLNQQNEELTNSLARSLAQVEMLESSNRDLKETLQNDDNKNRAKSALLVQERDSLAQSVGLLEDEIRQLKSRIEKLENRDKSKKAAAQAHPAGAPSAGAKSAGTDSKKLGFKLEQITPVEIVDKLIANLNYYKGINDASEQVVKEKHKKCIDQIREYLAALDQKTNGKYSAEIQNVNTELNSDDFSPNKNVWPFKKGNKQYFKTADTTQKRISGNIIPILEGIKEKINKK